MYVLKIKIFGSIILFELYTVYRSHMLHNIHYNVNLYDIRYTNNEWCIDFELNHTAYILSLIFPLFFAYPIIIIIYIHISAKWHQIMPMHFKQEKYIQIPQNKCDKYRMRDALHYIIIYLRFLNDYIQLSIHISRICISLECNYEHSITISIKIEKWNFLYISKTKCIFCGFLVFSTFILPSTVDNKHHHLYLRFNDHVDRKWGTGNCWEHQIYHWWPCKGRLNV